MTADSGRTGPSPAWQDFGHVFGHEISTIRWGEMNHG
jgi:hypothetical protein